MDAEPDSDSTVLPAGCSEPAAASCRNEAGDAAPPSFSQVDLAASPAEVKQRFPLFPGRHKALTCTVHAGVLWSSLYDQGQGNTCGVGCT